MVGRLVVSLVVLVACGRHGFDSGSRTDASGNGDGDIGGDGSGDADLGMPGAAVRIEQRISSNGNAFFPALAWNGTRVAFVWQEYRAGVPDLFFNQIDANGVLAGEVQLTSDPAAANKPDLVWTGAGYGVGWYNNGSIRFLTANASAAVTGGPTGVSENQLTAMSPSVAWNGTDYGVAFSAQTDGGRFVRVTTTATSGASVLFGTQTFFASPNLIWIGDRYGVVWGDNSTTCRLNYRELDVAGAAIGLEHEIVVGNQVCTSDHATVWTGTEYGLVFAVTPTGGGKEFRFMRFDRNGIPIGSSSYLDQGQAIFSPQITWNGTEYAVSWYRSPDNRFSFVRLTSDGQRIGAPLVVSATSATESMHVVSGAEYAVVWIDTRHGDTDLYAALIELHWP